MESEEPIIKETDELEGLNKSTIYYYNQKVVDSYNFEEFDIIKEMKGVKNFCATITSKRRTGKSVLMKDLCSKIKNNYESCYVFSLTSEFQSDLFDFVPKENLFTSFDEAKLEHIWNSQAALVKKLEARKVKKNDMPHVLILFDDLISEPSVRKSQILKRLFVAGRHCAIAQIFITQSFTAIPPVLRQNVDLAVAFYLDSAVDRESFAKQYLSTKSNRIGIMIFEKVTKMPYQAIVVLNFKTDSNPQKTIRTYTAQLKVPKFKIGKEIDTHSHTKNTFFTSPQDIAQGEHYKDPFKGLRVYKDPFAAFT